MKSPTQQAIIFLLEEYLHSLCADAFSDEENAYISARNEEKVRELLKEIKGGE